MKQTRTFRKWATRAFTASGSETIDLPLGADLESIQFYLTGTITNSVAWTGVRTEGLAKLIKRVEILANGETVATINGEVLTHGNFMRDGGVIKTNPLATAAVQTCEIVGILDFANIGGLARGKDTLLRTAGFRQLQARITWGTWTDLYTGAGTVSANTLSMQLSIRETKEHGDANGFSKSPEMRRLHRFLEKTYPASMVDRIQLDPNLYYRGLIIRTELTGDLSTAVLNNVKVQIGTDIVFDIDATTIVDANTQDYGWALPAGYYIVDFAPAPKGLSQIGDYLDLNGKNGDAFVILDVVGAATAKVQILSLQFQLLPEAVDVNRRYQLAMAQRSGAQG